MAETKSVIDALRHQCRAESQNPENTCTKVQSELALKEQFYLGLTT